jgi:hypothetical protein
MHCRRLPPTALAAALALAAPTSAEVPPPGFKVAFLGDQGADENAIAVLQLVAAEGADAAVHLGDFDYEDDPAGWDARVSSVLGADFPYFAVVGNHDNDIFYDVGGYQERIVARMGLLGIPWSGDLGAQAAFFYRGIHFVETAANVIGPGDGFHDLYIADQFAASDAVWRVSAWHKNMHLMQTGDKSDATGWGVYENSRRAGAIIATGHEHAYSRTHLLSSMQAQAIASTDEPLVLEGDEPATPADEGRSFAFVSGLGGQSIRPQLVFGDWFASVYTSTQGANYGALFAVFHVDADPRLARFYFKDVDGNVIDDFLVRSEVGVVDCPDADADGVCDEADVCSQVPNATQLDTDLDGYGNACDMDVGNDGVVGGMDFVAVGRAFGARLGEPDYDPQLDANGDGAIGGPDFAALGRGFGGAPGPSGLACAGTVPCAAP